jgi:hypothetical protein
VLVTSDEFDEMGSPCPGQGILQLEHVLRRVARARDGSANRLR